MICHWISRQGMTWHDTNAIEIGDAIETGEQYLPWCLSYCYCNYS